MDLARASSGSSPHPWGIRDDAVPHRVEYRFIPTSVGNTRQWGALYLCGPVHPHIRGEYFLYHRSHPGSHGSSPHPWGIRFPFTLGGTHGRFIPTSVGNTVERIAEMDTRAVHPHIRGEYETGRRRTSRGDGSSPHPWGILDPKVTDPIIERFIPTSVGNTCMIRERYRYFTVHPHIRGEYQTLKPPKPLIPGSSPHPWGIPDLDRHGRWRLRFIPTSVGNTLSALSDGQSFPVHPHIRGEYDLPACNQIVESGSSPHPWGIHVLCERPIENDRFIPTSVGNTQYVSPHGRDFTVHPHIRGEYLYIGDKVANNDGSSPHPWGILGVTDNLGEKHRFIPTSVGNTLSGQEGSIRSAVHPHIRGEYRLS